MNPTNNDNEPVNDLASQPTPVEPAQSVPVTVSHPASPAPPLQNNHLTMPTTSASPAPSVPDRTKKPKKALGKIILIILAVLVFAGAVTGAFFLGKSKQKVIIKAPALQPINLPSQAVVISNCTEGRGKQYVLPENIPEGPIYDVQNSKVIAIEYNLNIAQITTNPDSLSNTILELTRKYPVNHFSIVPETPKAGETPQNIHLIMFVVSKEEAKAIKCNTDTNPQ